MKKTIKIDDDLNLSLIQMKYEGAFKSISDVIRYLFNNLKKRK